MSFSELIGSAKGPGVIGMLVALVVLMGFGTLFMLAFDESTWGGEPSLESMIRNSEEAILEKRSLISAGEEKLASAPVLKKISEKLAETASTAKATQTEIAMLISEAAERRSALEAFGVEMASYKNQYREFVRNKAEGTKIEELKTLDGQVYAEVHVRKVSAMGMEIRHRDGFKRIGCENLPEDLQDYYQFDKEQMIAEAQRETSVRNDHDVEVMKAHALADAQAEQQRAKDKEQTRQKSLHAIAAKRARLTQIAQEIRQLQSELLSSESAAAAARSAGRMHLSKSNTIRGSINRKRSEHSRTQSEIARLQASL